MSNTVLTQLKYRTFDSLLEDVRVDKYCVYMHRKKDDLEPFYIGVGIKKRPYLKKGRSVFWRRVVDKHGYTIEILATDLSEKEALSEEKRLVALYGRRNLGTGPLVNLTDGGRGCLRRTISEETRKKIGDKNRGRKQSEEITRAKKIDRTGRTLIWSEEARVRHAESMKYRRGLHIGGRKRPIVVKNITTGTEQVFTSSLIAEKFLGMRPNAMKNEFYKYNGMQGREMIFIKQNKFTYKNYAVERLIL